MQHLRLVWRRSSVSGSRRICTNGERCPRASSRYKPEEIVAKLRQVDVLVSQGQNMVDAIRQIGEDAITLRARVS